MNILMVLFVVFETIQGYRAIKRMTDYQVNKFHLHQFDEMSDIHDAQERGHPEEIGYRT